MSFIRIPQELQGCAPFLQGTMGARAWYLALYFRPKRGESRVIEAVADLELDLRDTLIMLVLPKLGWLGLKPRDALEPVLEEWTRRGLWKVVQDDKGERLVILDPPRLGRGGIRRKKPSDEKERVKERVDRYRHGDGSPSAGDRRAEPTDAARTDEGPVTPPVTPPPTGPVTPPSGASAWGVTSGSAPSDVFVYSNTNTHTSETPDPSGNGTDTAREATSPVPVTPPPVDRREPVTRVWDHWRQVMEHPDATLDDTRRRAILRGLELAPLPHCLQAIDGCARNDFYMARGEHAGRPLNNDVSVIFKNAASIDRLRAVVSERAPPVRAVVLPLASAATGTGTAAPGIYDDELAKLLQDDLPPEER